MVIHYKCPSCGDDMTFDSDSGKLSCPSCGRKEEIESFPDDFISMSFSDDEAREYHCENCGAVLITDQDTIATRCSFCGAGVVLADRLTGTLAPKMVIPFSISREEAEKAFKKWCRHGILCPSGFVSADRIKSITGMYVPFWMYDLNSRVQVSGIGTKIRTYRQGDYLYTETSYFDIYRDINLDYIKVPVDASKKMDDEYMDLLEPYNYDKLMEFKTPYLAGYIAEKYNYSDEDLLPRVRTKIEKYIDSFVHSTCIGYSTVNFTHRNIRTEKKRAFYVLLPVWMLIYDYRGKEYVFAMNGQTGKVVGSPPISLAKVAAWFFGTAAGSFLLMRLISFAMGAGF